MGLFKKISQALKKTKEALARKLDALLSGGELNDEFYEELTDILISSDVGFECSEKIVDRLRLYARKNKIRTSAEVKKALSLVEETLVEENLLDSISEPYKSIYREIIFDGKDDVIFKYFVNKKQELSKEKIKELENIKNHKHLIIRTIKNNTCLEPFNFYVVNCLGCDLTNSYFMFNDLFSQEMQNIYLEAINNNNLEYLTLDLLEYHEIKRIYDSLVDEGLNYEEIRNKLKNILDNQPKLKFKKKQ